VQVAGKAPPLARLVRPVALPRAGNEPFKFDIEFADQGGIVAASVDDSDIRVGGPAGFHQFAALSEHKLVGKNVVATYALKPPAGGWEAAPAGAYVFEMKVWQVHTADGRFVPESVLGSSTAPDAAAAARN
jgi:hypothetical protein